MPNPSIDPTQVWRVLSGLVPRGECPQCWRTCSVFIKCASHRANPLWPRAVVRARALRVNPPGMLTVKPPRGSERRGWYRLVLLVPNGWYRRPGTWDVCLYVSPAQLPPGAGGAFAPGCQFSGTKAICSLVYLCHVFWKHKCLNLY